MNITFCTASHIGNKRKTNEDSLFAQQQNDGSILLAVADGMGGMPGGKDAAAMATNAFSKLGNAAALTPHQLAYIAMEGHNNIQQYSELHPEMDGMGTTLTAALLQDEVISWVHVGDSRLYLLRDKKLKQLTTDHRFLSSMLIAGDISPEEARHHPLRNMLDQCLGCPDIQMEQGGAPLYPGDSLLLCTDGLHDELSFEELEEVLNKTNMVLASKAETLLRLALEAGGKDNITLIIAECGETPSIPRR